MIFDLLMSLMGTYGGRRCRVCTEALDRRDPFVMSEGVFSPRAS